jgi:hypothetical protein
VAALRSQRAAVRVRELELRRAETQAAARSPAARHPHRVQRDRTPAHELRADTGLLELAAREVQRAPVAAAADADERAERAPHLPLGCAELDAGEAAARHENSLLRKREQQRNCEGDHRREGRTRR